MFFKSDKCCTDFDNIFSSGAEFSRILIKMQKATQNIARVPVSGTFACLYAVHIHSTESNEATYVKT